MRKILTWLKRKNPENDVDQVAFAEQVKRTVTEVADTISNERRRLASLIRRELMVKEALVALDADNALNLEARRAVYETALTRLRKQINEIRNRWARMQKETTTLALDARNQLGNANDGLAQEVQEEISNLLSRLKRVRAVIATKMTLSARLYDGAALTA